MGFYSPETLKVDAKRHGVRVLNANAPSPEGWSGWFATFVLHPLLIPPPPLRVGGKQNLALPRAAKQVGIHISRRLWIIGLPLRPSKAGVPDIPESIA